MNKFDKHEERILAMMRPRDDGSEPVRIWFERRLVEDGYLLLTGVWLGRGCARLRMFDDPVYGTFPEDPLPVEVYAVVERLLSHPEIVRGYPGYSSEHSRIQREVYEHRDIPLPKYLNPELNALWES